MKPALPTAPVTYGLNGPSATVSVDNAIPAGLHLSTRKLCPNKRDRLFAYRPPPKEVVDTSCDLEIEFLVIDFYKVGSHESFYEDLKRYIKEELS